VTPSVAATGDTNPSDATGLQQFEAVLTIVAMATVHVHVVLMEQNTLD